MGISNTKLWRVMSDQREKIKIIADLIYSEMDLRNDVILYNQEYPTPPKDGLFVAISMLADTPFGASVQQIATEEEGLIEHQTVNVRETYQILSYSQDSSARLRRHEIIWALKSNAAQQAAEKYSFKIGYLPTSFVDVSEVEGTSRLNRYALTVSVLCAYSRERRVEYYNQFQDPPVTILTNP